MISSKNIIRAKYYYKKAKKYENRIRILFKKYDYEMAASMYKKAGILYKNEKYYEHGQQSFILAANCFLKIKNNVDAAKMFISSAYCLKKIDNPTFIDVLMRAIDIYFNNGSFKLAAKQYKKIAEYFDEKNDIKNALIYMIKASNLYLSEDMTHYYLSCLLKIGKYHTELKNYFEAAQNFENVIISYCENEYQKKFIGKYVFWLFLIKICQEENPESILNKYSDLRNSEYYLMKKIHENLFNPDKINDIFELYEKKYRRFSTWEQKLIKIVKSKIC